jgi:hypothetical protein
MVMVVAMVMLALAKAAVTAAEPKLHVPPLDEMITASLQPYSLKMAATPLPIDENVPPMRMNVEKSFLLLIVPSEHSWEIYGSPKKAII